MYKKILLSFVGLSLFYPIVTFAAILEVSCSSSSDFSNTCNQCFRQTENIYLWYGVNNLSDTWISWSLWAYIYPDENLSPVNIRSFYTNWEIQRWSWWFGWSTNLVDRNYNNWEFFKDWRWDNFIEFLPNTSWKILQSTPSFFIKFANLSPNIISNWRSRPLWETQYTIKYYNAKDGKSDWIQKTLKECVLNYPAWCWDWVLDTTYWEQCDPAIPVWQAWYNPNCSATCKIPTLPPGGGWTPPPPGWWWSLPCENWPTIWVQSSPITSTTPWLCKIWYAVWNFTSQIILNTTHYTWSCWWISGWACKASYTPSVWWWVVDTYCGDWIVQRQNSNLELEECDFWDEADWMYCNKADCTYKETTFPWHCQDWWSCEITIPNEWKMVFWPRDSVIIWEWMNPYIAHSLWRPFMRNDSDYDLYFDQICVFKKSGSTITWSSICTDAWIIKSWTTKYFSSTPNFVWAKISSWDYWDNILVTSIKHKWTTYENAYFASPLNVRVAKASIATVWWGTSYISDANSVWNISKVANNGVNPNENKNFVWVWVSSWSISSYSNNVNDINSVNKISDEWDKYSKSIEKISNNSWSPIWNTSNLSDFESYNWIENVFILKNKNFVVRANTFNSVSWARTYIIENWNLKINSNINYDIDNIAFVVKWWNIQIDKSVTRIDWTYVSIIKNWIGWKIEWSGWTTITVLNIFGSLYWDISDLVSKRTYVKQNSSNQIDVWTIVSFGSKLFRKPAPLISTFINEYLQAEKISK